MVDNGCLRLDEARKVVARLHDKLGVDLHVCDSRDMFLDALEGVSDPEVKVCIRK